MPDRNKSHQAEAGRETTRVSDESGSGTSLWAGTLSLIHVFAGPHGALAPGGMVEEDHLSDTPAHDVRHTLIMKKSAAAEEEEPIDLETALMSTGHGCFQWKLAGICGLIYGCCSLSTTTLSFVLPAAQYDFQLSSVDKGVLNTAPLWGMVVGAYVWGNFADSKGRKFVLFWALFIDACASFISSFCQQYALFYAVRIFNGFGIIGATSIVFCYMGEFLDHKHRDKFLSRLELFWTLGIISLPMIGFAILPFEFTIDIKDIFVYNSWRLFVFVCGIPTLTAAMFMLLMPESPRFLLLQGKLTETRDVLSKMYASNFRQPKDDYPVKVLDTHPEADSYFFGGTEKRSCSEAIKETIASVIKQHLSLFSGRSCINILLTCYIDFCLISVYYTMMLWVPELLNREEKYYQEHPGSHPSLCEVSKILVEEKPKDAKIPISTFVHTIITCLACLPTTFALLMLMSHVSKKILLFGIMISSAVPATLLAHVNSTLMTVGMLSTLKSMTNLAEAVLFCIVVEIFPITTRGTAMSFTVTVGRIGSIIGNLIFGSMIDKRCEQLFYGMAVILVSAGVVSLLLPHAKHEDRSTIHEREEAPREEREREGSQPINI